MLSREQVNTAVANIFNGNTASNGRPKLQALRGEKGWKPEIVAGTALDYSETA